MRNLLDACNTPYGQLLVSIDHEYEARNAWQPGSFQPTEAADTESMASYLDGGDDAFTSTIGTNVFRL